MMAINADAPFFFCQAAVPHLLESDGNIVNIASNAGLMGQAYTAVYCMSKGAVVQLTKSLAMEYVKTPHPGERHRPGRAPRPGLTASYQMPARRRLRPGDALLGHSGGWAPADDIAGLFAFVASDDGSNIHGAVLSSDRGITAG